MTLALPYHELGGAPGAEKGSFEVGIEDVVPLLRFELREEGISGNRGVVDEDIGAHEEREIAGDRLGRSHIELTSTGMVDGRTGGSEFRDEGRGESARASGDDDDGRIQQGGVKERRGPFGFTRKDSSVPRASWGKNWREPPE